MQHPSKTSWYRPILRGIGRLPGKVGLAPRRPQASVPVPAAADTAADEGLLLAKLADERPVDRHVVTESLKKALHARGVDTGFPPGAMLLPTDSTFEAPCGLKWMDIHGRIHMGCFSYAVSGYFNNVTMGRYVSIGEEVQMGRGDHSIAWLSTAPSFYHQGKFLEVGTEFNGAPEFHHYTPDVSNCQGFVGGSTIVIENDVWIGHRAYVRPGVRIGTGAIVGAYAVVTRDVPPYAVVVGNPGRVVRYRFDESLIARLLKTQWWTLAPWQLEGIDVSRPQTSIDALERRVAGTPPFQPTITHLPAILGA